MSEHLNKGTNRWNFGVLLFQGVTREVGYELSSEKLVLPFIYASLGGPLFFAGMLLSIVEFFRFVAQIAGAPLVALARQTKWYVGLTTGLSVLVLAVIAVLTDELSPQSLVIIFLMAAATTGLAKGLNTLAFQDLLGRSLFEHSRASLLFIGGSITGFFVILSVLGSIFLGEAESAHAAHIELILIGLGMMVAASLAVVFLKEPAKRTQAYSETDTHPKTLQSYLAELRIGIRTVGGLTWFRKYLAVRILLVPIEIAMPFFAIHASALHPNTAPSLSVFVIAGSVGMILGGLVFPPLSKTSIRKTMSAAAITACLAATGALTLQFVPFLREPLTHSGVFALLAFAAQGVIVSRIVYLVNAASDTERPYCITLSNLAGGIVGLTLAAMLGAITQMQGAIIALVIMLPLNIAAALFAMRLPKASEVEGVAKAAE